MLYSVLPDGTVLYARTKAELMKKVKEYLEGLS